MAHTEIKKLHPPDNAYCIPIATHIQVPILQSCFLYERHQRNSHSILSTKMLYILESIKDLSDQIYYKHLHAFVVSMQMLKRGLCYI